MKAGRMRHRVTIQSRSTTADATGEAAYSWSDVATVWASVDPISGNEIFASQGRQGRIPTEFHLRYLPGIEPGMRLIWDSRWFDITQILQLKGLKAELVIIAAELVDVPI